MLILTWKRLVIPGAPHRTRAIQESALLRLLQHHGVLLLGVHGVRLRLQLLHGRLQLLRVIVHAAALLGDLRRPLLQRHNIRLHPGPHASVHAVPRTADTNLKLYEIETPQPRDEWCELNEKVKRLMCSVRQIA